MTDTIKNIIGVLRGNTDEVSKVIIKLHDSVIEKLQREQKITSNSLFIVYLSLLNSSNATQVTKEGVVFLISTILEQLSTSYIEQNFSFLLPHFISSIKNYCEKAVLSPNVYNTIVTTFPLLFLKGNKKGTFMKFIAITITEGKPNDSLAACDLISDILYSTETVINSDLASSDLKSLFLDNFAESFSNLILCCVHSGKIRADMLSLISRFIHCFNDKALQSMLPIIEWIVQQQRHITDSINFSTHDQIIIQLIHHTKPEILLPLISSLKTDIKTREWFLPLLVKHFQGSFNLSVFVSWFLPWIDSYLSRQGKLEEDSIHYVFTWGFLPKLIKNPPDLEKTLPGLVSTIKSSLLDSRVASVTCNAICVMIDNNQEIVTRSPTQDILKSLIQTLRTCFIAAPKDHKTYFFNTIIHIASTLQEQECISHYDKELVAFNSKDNDFHIELLSAFAIHSTCNYESFLIFARKQLLSLEKHVHKKIFKALNLFFSKLSEKSEKQSNPSLDQIILSFVQFCIDNPDPGKNFYRFLRGLFSYLSKTHFDTSLKLLPELVLGCRPGANPTIYQICVDTCMSFAHNFVKDHIDTQLERLFGLFGAGLASHSTLMIASSMTFVALLITEFKEHISQSLYDKLLMLIESIDISLSGKECLGPFIDLIKSLIFVKQRSEQHLSKFIILLMKTTTKDDGTLIFKLKLRHIIEKCIKVYGEEKMEKLFKFIPEHCRLFSYIKKQLRYKKAREAKESNTKPVHNRIQKFIHSTTGDPIDLMSHNYSIAENHVQEEFEDFRIGEDGRLVIDKPSTKDAVFKSKVQNYSESEDESWQDVSAPRQIMNKPTINLPFKYSGNAFKAKKGRGDILKSNSMEPFAYIPLKKKLLKQHRSKSRKAKLLHL